MKFKLSVIGCLAALLGGCAQDPPQVPPAPPPPVLDGVGCDAAGAQFAVGKEAGEQLIAQARTEARAQRVRTVRPGQAVTMEYDGSRLTLDIDAGGRVVRASCG